VAAIADRHLGTFVPGVALVIALVGAGISIFSSNLRIVGVYGLAAAMALAPAAVVSWRIQAGRSLAIFAVPLLAGLLAGGHYYPDPGLGWSSFIALMLAPAMLLAGLVLPERHAILRAAAALLAVAVVVGAVTVPTALAAKRAAEADPYSAYK
jgi:hypothetical protein